MAGFEDEKAPLFSIITPTFRRPELLKRNIISVQQQTYKNYEHIIVDDGNDNQTARLIEELSDDRIIFIQHDSNRRAAASYNTGILKSRGDLILFLDDDDEYLPTFLEKMSSEFSRAGKDIGFIWSGISRIKDTPDGEKFICNLVWPRQFTGKGKGFAAATSISNGFGVCVRKECIEDIGLYDENIGAVEDTDFMFRLALRFDFRTIPEVLVKVHQHNLHQVTAAANSVARIKGKELILDRYQNVLRKRPAAYTAHYYGYADLCYISGERTRGREALLSIIKMRPFRLLTYADMVSYELFGTNFGSTTAGKGVKKIIRLFVTDRF